jgi:hypothetical protein
VPKKKPPPEARKFISPEQLGTRWGLGRATIYRMVKDGRIKSIRGIGPIRIPLDFVERKEREAGLVPGPAK